MLAPVDCAGQGEADAKQGQFIRQRTRMMRDYFSSRINSLVDGHDESGKGNFLNCKPRVVVPQVTIIRVHLDPV